MTLAPVQIVEVSPRDGLQAEAAVVGTDDKLALIERLVAAGSRRLEVCSFVNPNRVPQMADAEAVLAGLDLDDPDVTYIGLVLNERGLDRAISAGMHEINAVVVCSDTFGQRNQAATVDQTVDAFATIARRAADAGIRTTATVSVAFGCPYEGEIGVDRVTDVAKRVAEAGADEVAIADTIGVAVPSDVASRVAAVRAVIGDVPLRAHFHDTRHTGVANVAAAVAAGVTVVDASLGGVGGCPFAPGATGNVATEDVAYLLHRTGHDTGLDLDALIDAVAFVESLVAHPASGALARAGAFPGTRAAT
jgi:hydroxymethylglutaryl-CoA lyase